MHNRNREVLIQRSGGMSLIEVLVALLVFGVGVVGYAALQLTSVRQVEETYSRSQAMSIAQDFIERARVNRSPEAMGYYLQSSSWSTELQNPGQCTITDTVPTAGDACDSLAIARADVYQVRASLANLLDNGKVDVTPCESVYCVTVAWAETQLNNCDQSAFADGERQANAHCVRVEFIP